jgi:hypothetical protein
LIRAPIFIALATVGLTFGVMFFWSRNLEFFPQIPELLIMIIAWLTGTTNQDGAEQLTFCTLFSASFILACGLTVPLGLFLMGRWRVGR